MTDIAQHLPKHTETVKRIYEAYKKTGDAEPARGYLGASIIGYPCERYLWYTFRQATLPGFSGRMYRLFETGDLEEARFVKNLRDIGCEVHDVEPPYGRQFEASAFGGHFSGHMDGCALGIPEAPKTWHVLEFKTHKEKSFKDLKKKGVQKSKPVHYAQMQIYMHLTDMKRALYLAVNKNDDELYSERIRYDKDFSLRLLDKAQRIITSSDPPPRISKRKDYYQCSWCDAKLICHGTESPDPALPLSSLSCRQCCHATPLLDTEGAWWKCELTKQPLSMNRQDSPCVKHLVLPGLIAFAEPTNHGTDDEGSNFIEFTNTDGTKWKHGNSVGCHSSKELRIIPANLLADKMVHEVKEVFGAVVTQVQDDILSRYPAWLPDAGGKHSKQVGWKGPVSELEAAWKKRYKEDLLSLTLIARYASEQFNVIELEGARIAVIWNKSQQAEIREAVAF